jgi:hypothetical protein
VAGDIYIALSRVEMLKCNYVGAIDMLMHAMMMHGLDNKANEYEKCWNHGVANTYENLSLLEFKVGNYELGLRWGRRAIKEFAGVGDPMRAQLSQTRLMDRQLGDLR